MGVINRSPNSFYHPYLQDNDAINAVAQMVNAGAAIIDVGGEATNPFVDLQNNPVSAQQEIERLVPLIEKISQRFDVLISVDTSRPEVMRETINAGADMINDQRGLKLQDALITAVELKTPVCLMHFFYPMRHPSSTDLVSLFQQVKQDLTETATHCIKEGMLKDRIILDPGFGTGNYGKNSQENYYLLSRLQEFTEIGFPLLVGWSRKSMIGEALGGAPVEERLYGSIAAATISAMLGASIIRTHDVKETRDAMQIVKRVNAFTSTLGTRVCTSEVN